MFPLVALFAPLLVGDDARAISLSERLRPPSTSHLLGTDELGRDVLSRLVLGARVSVTVGIVSSALALLIGSLAGAAAGLAPRFDPAVLFAINVVSALPSLVLAAAGAALLGSTAVGVILLIALTSWPDTARLVRSEARRVVQAPFVDAARAAGASGPRVLLVHVLPHALLPAIAGAPYVLGGAVLTEAALSFLGLGTPPPAPSWGRALSDSRGLLGEAWWCVLPPGIALLLFVLAARALGDTLTSRRLQSAAL